MISATRAGEAGFTLIELLVSLALLALLMAMVPSTLTLARREAQIAVELDRRAEFDTALNFVEQRLAETTAIHERGKDGFFHIIFRGDASRVGFVAPLTVARADDGLVRFDLGTGRDSDGRRGLILTWSPWRPAPPEEEEVPAAHKPQPQPRSRLIVPNAQSLRLRYRGLAADGETPIWTDNWRRPDLPDVVELSVVAGGVTKVRTVILRLKTP